MFSFSPRESVPDLIFFVNAGLSNCNVIPVVVYAHVIYISGYLLAHTLFNRKNFT